MSSTHLLVETEEGSRGEGCIDLKEAKRQILFSVPMILTNMSYNGMNLVAVMFAGHLGDAQLAGANLGCSWNNITGIALTIGLCGATETLCGQAYGAKMYKMLGIYLQSSIIINTLFSILASFLCYFSEPVFILLHQNPDVAKMASLYLRFQIPGLFATAYSQCLLRFFQTQSVVIPPVVCSAVPLVIDMVLTYLLVHTLGLGVMGASLAGSISLWISFIMLVMYVNRSERFRSTWEGLSVEAFQYVFPILKLAIPSALMICLEFTAFEILVLIAGLLPNSIKNTSIVAMCINTEAITYSITYGFSAAVSTRVSNEIGAGNTKKAKNAVAVTLKLAFFLSATVLLLLAVGHNTWARSFTDNPVIVKEFASMTPFLAVSILLDSAQNCLSGVARGCGWQHSVAWTNLLAFYLIGTPLALLFGFKFGLQNKGLWIGLICGLFCQVSALLVITLRSKWTKFDLVAKDEQNRVLT